MLMIDFGLFSLSFLQIVALVFGRWLLGFAFSKHDLELLDDPIPDSLYCRKCRQKNLTKMGLSQGSSKDSVSDSYDIEACRDFPVTVEPVASNGSIPSESHNKLNDSFNLTREVDKCDIWKNMVKTLDAAPGSGNEHWHSVDAGRESGVGNGNKMWLVTDSDYRELGTLEECDTDLEACPVSTSADECRESDGTERRNRFVFHTPGVTSIRTSSPRLSSRESKSSRHGGYEGGKESDEGVASDYQSAKYKMTSV